MSIKNRYRYRQLTFNVPQGQIEQMEKALQDLERLGIKYEDLGDLSRSLLDLGLREIQKMIRSEFGRKQLIITPQEALYVPEA